MYVHNGKQPVVLLNDPIDPDCTRDNVYFIYDDWLESSESITTHTAIAASGVDIVTQSTSIGPVTINGTVYNSVYVVQIKPSTGSTQVVLTHRISTSRAGIIDLGRLTIDHTVKITVKAL